MIPMDENEVREIEKEARENENPVREQEFSPDTDRYSLMARMGAWRSTCIHARELAFRLSLVAQELGTALDDPCSRFGTIATRLGRCRDLLGQIERYTEKSTLRRRMRLIIVHIGAGESEAQMPRLAREYLDEYPHLDAVEVRGLAGWYLVYARGDRRGDSMICVGTANDKAVLSDHAQEWLALCSGFKYLGTIRRPAVSEEEAEEEVDGG